MSQSKKEFREFWIGTDMNGKPTWVNDRKPSGIRGAVCTGPDIHVITYESYTAKCAEVDELVTVLSRILEIGKRDMSNPKYDGYFHSAKQVLNKHQQGEGNPKGGNGE